MKQPSQKQLKGVQLREGFVCRITRDYEGYDFEDAPEWFRDLLEEMNADEGLRVRIIVERERKEAAS